MPRFTLPRVFPAGLLKSIFGVSGLYFDRRKAGVVRPRPQALPMDHLPALFPEENLAGVNYSSLLDSEARKKRILLAEDNLHLREMTKKLLESQGYDVLVAQNGLEAVAMATLAPPDLVILDIMIPIMDGFQVASHIRKNSKTRAVPILAATVLSTLDGREKYLASGIDGYLAKPFTSAGLKAAIDKILAARTV
jgi:CheY-like chemotaxis protein